MPLPCRAAPRPTALADYVQWVRTQGGGKGAVGIPAPASTPEFLVKVVGEKYQLDLVSAPYRGSAPMMADMLGNQISAGVGSVQDFMENHKAGKLRVVAVLGTKRQAAMPEVPTFDELGLKGFEDLPYYGIYAPAGTRKSSSPSSRWRWPRWWPSPRCATTSPPWASPWAS
jgi:tripartite-type tricarboxylate transporter receptor subunit TctC